MLSLFPTLLSWQEVSPLIIRVVLGAVFLFWAYKALKGFAGPSTNKKIAAIIELIVGVLLVIGLWTQAAAIVAAINLIIRLIERAQKKAFLTDGVNYYLILLVLSLSLIVTGAGIWAIDYTGL
jgi:putative oxidoreductase